MNDVSPLIYDVAKYYVRDPLKGALGRGTWSSVVSRMRSLGMVTLGDAMRFRVGQTPFMIHGSISVNIRRYR